MLIWLVAYLHVKWWLNTFPLLYCCSKYPKTDYTYSRVSPHRKELAPGVIPMPNMSRRSLSTVRQRGSSENRNSSSTVTTVSKHDVTKSRWVDLSTSGKVWFMHIWSPSSNFYFPNLSLFHTYELPKFFQCFIKSQLYSNFMNLMKVFCFHTSKLIDKQ
jgi:hypothetical protein